MTHRTHGFVKAMLEDGASGRELIHSLTYSATDFGLFQTENSSRLTTTNIACIQR
jgi:hypothetical protein